jgi:membrane protein implicated in regulation of membrane protease activity
MVDFSFQGLFLTTLKGLPDLSALPSSTTLSFSTYIYSLALQVIIFLVFMLYFILSVYRVVKKIKNDRFQEVPEEEKR